MRESLLIGKWAGKWEVIKTPDDDRLETLNLFREAKGNNAVIDGHEFEEIRFFDGPVFRKVVPRPEAKAEVDAQAKAEADAQAKAEADAQAKAEADAQAKEEADAQAKAEAPPKAKAPAQKSKAKPKK